MLRHSLATWRKSRILFFFTELYYPENLPLFCCRELLSLFCLYEGECILAGPRACPRDCSKGIHPIKNRKERATPVTTKKRERVIQRIKRACVKKNLCELSLFFNFWRVCKQNSLNLQEFLIMKNYGITLTRGNYETSGRQSNLHRGLSILNCR